MSKNHTTDNALLLRRLKEGDESAKNELVSQNMGLVHSVVKRFSGRGCEVEDLTQIGAIGLIRAAERFDTSYNVKFSTYAIPMIIGEIKRFLRDDGIIKVSRSIKEIGIKAERVREKIIFETGKEPTITEISKRLDISPSELSLAIEAKSPPQSIDAKYDCGDGEGSAVIDRLESEKDEIATMIDKVSLRQIITELDERDREIIKLRYFVGITQSETAVRLGISQVQVSRLEKKILKSMRNKMFEE